MRKADSQPFTLSPKLNGAKSCGVEMKIEIKIYYSEAFSTSALDLLQIRYCMYRQLSPASGKIKQLAVCFSVLGTFQDFLGPFHPRMRVRESSMIHTLHTRQTRIQDVGKSCSVTSKLATKPLATSEQKRKVNESQSRSRLVICIYMYIPNPLVSQEDFLPGTA